MLLRIRMLLLTTVFLLPGATLAGATEVLAYVPQNALGFALVHDARTANEKSSHLLSIFAEGLPAPLDVAQTMMGLSEGLNLNGDLLFALLPVSDPAGLPAPVFLLPVADYATFATSVQGDATGEICRVTIAEEDVLVAKRDDYAVLMNVEHRDLMQTLIASEAVMHLQVDTFKEWLGTNDISVVVTAAGLAHVARVAEELKSSSQPVVATDPFGEPRVTNEILQLADSMPFAEFLTRSVTWVGVGLAIDNDTNARIRCSVKFDEPDNVPEPKQTGQQALVGFEDKPYAFAGGGDLPTEFAALLPDFFTSIARETAVQDGREDFTEQDWADVRKMHDLWLGGLKSVSCLLEPGKEGGPLLSVLFARLTVQDSTAYLEAIKQVFELSGQLEARSKSDIKFNFSLSPLTIAEAKGFEATCDFDKATGDGNNIPWQAFLTTLFGVDHKLSLYFVASDEQQIVFAMESAEKLASFVEAVRRRETGLTANTQVKKTFTLLERDANWNCLVNPQGLVELVRNAMNSMQILGFAPEFPLYPSAPPLGVTLSADQTTWQGEVVMPVEAARAMAQFTKEVEAAFR